MTAIKKAVIRTGGKQYNVKTGDRIKVDLLNAEPGSSITISDVLLAVNEDQAINLDKSTKVQAKVLGHNLDKKAIIFKKNRRTGYTKKQGHRQKRTELLIESIN
jgi:large subunit ribosomal protein L21